MTQKMTIWGTVNIVIGIVNLILFILWLSIIKLESYNLPSERNYFYEAISLQITVLDIIVVFVTIVLTIVGVFGYSAIKSGAVTGAVNAAQEEIDNIKTAVNSTMNDEITRIKADINKTLADFIKQETDKRANFLSDSFIDKKAAKNEPQLTEPADKM